MLLPVSKCNTSRPMYVSVPNHFRTTLLHADGGGQVMVILRFYFHVRVSIPTMDGKKYYGRENVPFNRSNIVACRTCMYKNKWPNKPQANWSIHK